MGSVDSDDWGRYIMLKFFVKSLIFSPKKCPIMKTVKLHNRDISYKVGSVLNEIKEIRNFLSKCNFFTQNALAMTNSIMVEADSFRTTLTKVILTDNVRTESCLSISRMGTHKHGRYGHFQTSVHNHPTANQEKLVGALLCRR